MKINLTAFAATATVLLVANGANAANLVASYDFNGSLNSSVGGAPALTLTDPLGTSGYVSDIVGGVSRTVLDIKGQNNPTNLQGGLTFDSTGLLTPDKYSVALKFEFLDRPGAWRRIIDVEGRQSDNGFYVDPGNNLDVFPISGSGVPFTTGEYHTVILTVDTSGTLNNVHAYIDGLAGSLEATTNIMAISNTGLVNLFLDNVVAGGQFEWSEARIAQADFYNGILGQQDVIVITGGVPEPATWAMMLLGFGGLGAMMRRRRAQAAFA